MTGCSRRFILQLGGVAAVGALISADAPWTPGSGRRGEVAGEEGAFASLRRRWREMPAGAGFDAAAEPYRTRLAELGSWRPGTGGPWRRARIALARPPVPLAPGHPGQAAGHGAGVRPAGNRPDR
nr:hypothetical protein GCM10020093_011330 [Planobispora longispora]